MIKLSSSAKEYMQANLQDSPCGTLGIRIGLRDAGCSGFAYTIDFAKEQTPSDHIFDFDMVKIFIDQAFVKQLAGTEIDYVVAGINSNLQFNNPNVINSCGCGESFQFKEDKQV